MPDIMSLPQLCDTLGISVDALLEMPVSLKNKNIVKDFCEYALENDANSLLLEILAKLFYAPPNSNDHAKENSAVLLTPDCLRVYDAKGVGFVIGSKKMMKDCLDTDIEDAIFNLKKLADVNCLAVLKCISLDSAVTLEEISSLTGIDGDTVYKITFSLMKRNFIVCDVDANGKRGYLQGAGIAGVYMILAGCLTLFKDGALHRGNLLFTRTGNK